MQLTIILNRCIAKQTYHMRFSGDTRQILRAGQFVQIQLPSFYLRRPISVYDYHANETGTLDIIYKVVGKGTEYMAHLPEGTTLDVLMGLGNGYDTNIPNQKPLLIGGGVGVPPLYALCKELLLKGQKPQVIMGFNTSDEVFGLKAYQALGVPVTLTTVDGSQGMKGFVTDAMHALQAQYDYVYTCGPEPMLKAIHALTEKQGITGQYSFEERMACGFGACMGCSCETKYGPKRICKDGPVLFSEDILW